MALNNAQTKINSLAFRSMLEKHQLTGPNFNEWFRALKLVMITEKLQDVFETALPPAPAARADAQTLADWAVLFYRHNKVACLMLGTMSPKLYQQFEHNSPLDMATELQENIWKTSGIKRNKQPIFGASSTPQVMAIQGGRVQKYKPQGKAKGKGNVRVPKTLILLNPKSLNLTRKSIQKKMDNVTTTKRKDIGKGTVLFSMNNMLYFNAIIVNGIYEIDMRDYTLPIVNSMYSISNKRTKSNLDSTYLWHCRLGHINKKRIEKLQHDGLLKSTDNEPFDQCVSCISDMCQKKGASYFISFTDDYSHDSYVYLLKHKHEVFETFKVFKSDVENQLRKIIKAIRSDRGGEYISQEFKDYLKACGIVQQLTPPYTPQHNGVSERQSAARILNMVPTKKVDKTPYELWHEKVPNLSYLKETMGYNLYYPPENKIVVERYADFLETDFILQKESGRIVELEDEDILPSENTSKHPIKEESLALIFSQEEDVIPQSMYDNKVWRLVVLLPNAKVVKSKWIYKKKADMDGKETFSPIADIRAIRILINIVAYYDYEIWEMDVKTVFLNGFLEEKIYMEQLEGFIDPIHPRKVCKLQRSIYGLKQASRSWNKRFDDEIKKFGFHQNLDEPCIYQKASGSNVIFLILYVDDIILMRNHVPSLQEVKTYLGKFFSMKDLGEAAFILGIKIYRDRSSRLIGLSQNAYLDKILKRYRMDNSKRGSIPMQFELHLRSIMYAVRCTRPDVAFAQNITSRFQQNSGEAHWTAVKNILKYLRNTKDTFFVYGGDPEAELRVNCYCDAEFETDRDDTKSQTGYVFVLNGGAVVWKSSKQSTTTQHATEAEHIAASEAAKEAVLLRKSIDEPGVVSSNDYPIKMNYDNSAAIIMAKESGIQKGARHFKKNSIMFVSALKITKLILSKFIQMTI
uniref:Integrase catalytic domain-containing protein n=1 Tax=Tanacetum cinerariifolium TaxID=118510 RepID=A0A6L2J345_TANCI|nr:hypothetical protein [Tanacetum cinerariifolium]